MFKGLRNKFLFLHMGVVTAIMALFFCVIWLSNYQGVMQRSDETLLRDMEGQGRRPADLGFPRENRVNPRFSPTFTIELDEDGAVVQVRSVFSAEEGFYREVAAAALEKAKDTAIISYEGSRFKYLLRGRRLVFIDISGDMQTLAGMGLTFLWIALPLLLALFLISLFFANRSIRPVEESYNKQKEFIADASHELKTPLAAISANVDLLLSDADEGQGQWLRRIKAEIGRMDGLTQSLLFLTKLDYQRESEGMERFDLSKVAEDLILPLEAVFYERGLNAKVEIAPGVSVHGNSEQLRRLLGTLLDNAVKYSGGQIRVSLEKKEGAALLTVFNDGKGIAPEELGKIWNRFYRGDKSRNAAGGFGLGLPIAKAIAEKHGGGISAESKEGEWARFVVRLPLDK